MGPNEELMARYGTRPVFEEKTAEGTPFAAKILFAMVAMKMARNYADELQIQRLEAQNLNNQFQNMQRMNLGPTRDAMEHSRPKAFIAPALPMGGPQDPNAMAGIPLGWDEGMVRTAAVAQAAGADLAKVAVGGFDLGGALGRAGGALRKAFQPGVEGAAKAAIPPTLKQPPISAAFKPVADAARGVQRKVVGAGALGLGVAGLGALAGTRSALGYLSSEQEQPTYGATPYGAPQLSYGVNQYGQPQIGSPFIQ